MVLIQQKAGHLVLEPYLDSMETLGASEGMRDMEGEKNNQAWEELVEPKEKAACRSLNYIDPRYFQNNGSSFNGQSVLLKWLGK